MFAIYFAVYVAWITASYAALSALTFGWNSLLRRKHDKPKSQPSPYSEMK